MIKRVLALLLLLSGTSFASQSEYFVHPRPAVTFPVAFWKSSITPTPSPSGTPATPTPTPTATASPTPTPTASPTVTPGGPGDFSPILWLKADALGLSDNDPVSTWTDSSGNGNDATSTGGARPTFKTAIVNGMPVVRFDGSDDFMKVTALPYGAFTIFYVYNVSTGGIIGEHSTNGGSNSGDYHYQPGGAHFAANATGGGGALSAFDSTSPSIGTSTWLLISRTMDGTHAGHLAWVNGVSVTRSSFVGTSNPGTATITDDYYIGARAGTALFTAGDIAEIIIIPSVLSDPDRESIEAGLDLKYGF